ncbi:MAG TPA: Ig-like domain-containing protein, partial [Myxococcota bacterium]
MTVDGVLVGTTTANASGAWTYTTATLSEGVHTASATATVGGSTSASSNVPSFTVDSLAPAAPVVITPANGSTTASATPTISGTAEANATVRVFLDGAQVGTTTANGSGAWSFVAPVSLADGSHTARATAVDAANNVSGNSNTNTFSVDTTAPAAPVVTTPANGSVTNNTTPTVTGTAEANSTVRVFIDGVQVGTAAANGSGAWTYTTSTLSAGSHTVRASAVDAVGNVSSNSNTNTFSIDTTAPAAPVVTTPANGARSANQTPAYSGTAEASSTVRVFIDGVQVGTTTANGSGAWSFTQPTSLAEGSHTVSVTATDAAGNTSVSSNTNTFTVDVTPPSAPVVVTPSNGSSSNTQTPVVTGTAEAGSTVAVFVDGVQ